MDKTVTAECGCKIDMDVSHDFISEEIEVCDVYLTELCEEHRRAGEGDTVGLPPVERLDKMAEVIRHHSKRLTALEAEHKGSPQVDGEAESR